LAGAFAGAALLRLGCSLLAWADVTRDQTLKHVAACLQLLVSAIDSIAGRLPGPVCGPHAASGQLTPEKTCSH